MLVNTKGFIFDCREDANGKIGVMNSYKLLYRGDDMRVTVVLTVDSTGKIVVPSNMNKSLGFRSLRDICKDRPQVENFAKSNKPYFSVLGEFSLVVAGYILFNRETKELKSTDNLFFYLPKTVARNIPEITDNNGNQQPALVCERISRDKGLNCFCVSPEIYQSYLANFMRCIDANACEDRGSFLSSIVL